MEHFDHRGPVDIDLEIAGLENEAGDLKASVRLLNWSSAIAITAGYAIGPDWLLWVDRTQQIVMATGLVVLVGVSERLLKNRLAAIRSEIIILRAFLHAEFGGDRRALAMVDAIARATGAKP